jgi:hypothetical protein
MTATAPQTRDNSAPRIENVRGMDSGMGSFFEFKIQLAFLRASFPSRCASRCYLFQGDPLRCPVRLLWEFAAFLRNASIASIDGQ